VIHCLNYIAGLPYYRTRQQFIRVFKANLKKSEEYTNHIKLNNGISFNKLNNVICDGETLFSANYEFEWDREMISQ
jgi:hypothetical protein